MIKHEDGSVTYTPEEIRCISVAYSDLYTVICDMPSALEDFVGEYAALNIRKARYFIDGDEWPGIHAYLKGERDEYYVGDDIDDYPREYQGLLDVDEETAERMLTMEMDDYYEDAG